MKTKKRFSIYALITIFFTLLYLLIAAKPLSKEYQFTPDWKIQALTPVIDKVSDTTERMHFLLGQNSGYFTEDGKITLYNSFPSKITISDSYYAIYSAEAKNVPFYDNLGNMIGTIEAAGYPYFVDDELFVFLPGGSSFSKSNSDGTTRWTMESTIPITAFTANKNFCAVGYANGNIKLFSNNDGSILMDYFPGGSDLPVILGLGISSDGEYIASISGHNRQRFVLANKVNNQPKIIFHSFLKTETNERTLVHFTKDNNTVFYNYGKNLGIYNLSTKKEKNIKLDNRLISIQESDSLVYLLGKNKSNYTVYMVENTNKLEGKFSFTANQAFIKTNDNLLFIGKDNYISKLSITKE